MRSYLVPVYVTYLVATIGLCAWLAHTLFRNGAVFLADVFDDRPDLAEAVNRLLVTGFAMLNLGYGFFLLQGGTAADGAEAVEVLVRKLGILLVSLAVVHFANMAVFHWINGRRRQAQLAPPVAPQRWVDGFQPPQGPAGPTAHAAHAAHTAHPAPTYGEPVPAGAPAGRPLDQRTDTGLRLPPPAGLTVFYDGACELCLRCRSWLEEQPTAVPLRFVTADAEWARRWLPDLPWLGTELVVVADDGAAWVGPAAFITCLWATTRYRSWSHRLSGPAFAPMAERFFLAVSANRGRIAAALGPTRCDDDGCAHRRAEPAVLR